MPVPDPADPEGLGYPQRRERRCSLCPIPPPCGGQAGRQACRSVIAHFAAHFEPGVVRRNDPGTFPEDPAAPDAAPARSMKPRKTIDEIARERREASGPDDGSRPP